MSGISHGERERERGYLDGAYAAGLVVTERSTMSVAVISVIGPHLNHSGGGGAECGVGPLKSAYGEGATGVELTSATRHGSCRQIWQVSGVGNAGGG